MFEMNTRGIRDVDQMRIVGKGAGCLTLDLCFLAFRRRQRGGRSHLAFCRGAQDEKRHARSEKREPRLRCYGNPPHSDPTVLPARPHESPWAEPATLYTAPAASLSSP